MKRALFEGLAFAIPRTLLDGRTGVFFIGSATTPKMIIPTIMITSAVRPK